MPAKTEIVYDGNLRCHVLHRPSQQTIPTDVPVEKGGTGSAISPMDLFSSSLGACMVTVMGMAAQRCNLDITGAHVEVTQQSPLAPSHAPGPINIKITLPKNDLPLSPADVELLAAAAKNCPVKHMLHPDLHVVTEVVSGQ